MARIVCHYIKDMCCMLLYLGYVLHVLYLGYVLHVTIFRIMV